MPGLLDNLSALLETAGAGTRGTDLYWGDFPPEVIEGIVLVEVGGYPHARSFKGVTNRNPTVQVKARGRYYDDVRARIEAAYGALELRENVRINGTFYLSIEAINEPADVGQLDAGSNTTLAFNVQVKQRT